MKTSLTSSSTIFYLQVFRKIILNSCDTHYLRVQTIANVDD